MQTIKFKIDTRKEKVEKILGFPDMIQNCGTEKGNNCDYSYLLEKMQLYFTDDKLRAIRISSNDIEYPEFLKSIKIGDEKNKVLNKLGEPNATENNDRIWTYTDNITYMFYVNFHPDGTVENILYQSAEILARETITRAKPTPENVAGGLLLGNLIAAYIQRRIFGGDMKYSDIEKNGMLQSMVLYYTEMGVEYNNDLGTAIKALIDKKDSVSVIYHLIKSDLERKLILKKSMLSLLAYEVGFSIQSKILMSMLDEISQEKKYGESGINLHNLYASIEAIKPYLHDVKILRGLIGLKRMSFNQIHDYFVFTVKNSPTWRNLIYQAIKELNQESGYDRLIEKDLKTLKKIYYLDFSFYPYPVTDISATSIQMEDKIIVFLSLEHFIILSLQKENNTAGVLDGIVNNLKRCIVHEILQLVFRNQGYPMIESRKQGNRSDYVYYMNIGMIIRDCIVYPSMDRIQKDRGLWFIEIDQIRSDMMTRLERNRFNMNSNKKKDVLSCLDKKDLEYISPEETTELCKEVINILELDKELSVVNY